MTRHLVRFGVVVVLVAVCGLGGAAPASAVDPDCLKDPVVGNTVYASTYVPELTTKNEPVELAVWGALLADCPNTTVTARTPGGGLISVPLNQNLSGNNYGVPDRLGGVLTLPLGYGAGLWQLTKITSGGASKTLHHPFDVFRGGEITLNTPPTVAAPNPVTVSGTFRRYTSTGSLAAAPNVTIAIRERELLVTDRAYLKTNSAGAFSGTVAMPPGETNIDALVPDQTDLYGTSPIRKATVTEPLPPPPVTLDTIAYTSTAYVNQWWRVDANTGPGAQYNDLQKPTQTGWKTTGSFGWSTSAGKLTRWWKPVSPGTYTLRLRAGGNYPAYHQLSKQITVTSKQTIPTYVDAKVRPTNGGTVYGGTPMTLDGHLKVRYSNGTIGPYAGQQIRIQARKSGTTDWTTTIGTVKTSSTGYFITHWAMRYQSKVDIRFLFLSPYITIKNGQIVKTVPVSP